MSSTKIITMTKQPLQTEKSDDESGLERSEKQHVKLLVVAYFFANASFFIPVLVSTNLIPTEISNPKDLSAAYFAAQVLSLSASGSHPSSPMVLLGRIVLGFLFFAAVIANKNASWKEDGATAPVIMSWLFDYIMGAVHLVYTLYCLKNPPHSAGTDTSKEASARGALQKKGKGRDVIRQRVKHK